MERIIVTPYKARRMILSGTAPADMHVTGPLYLVDCTSIVALPPGLSVTGSLVLTGCTGLTALPEGLSVTVSLCLFGCTSLTTLPRQIRVGRHSGRMIAHNIYTLIWDGTHYHAGCRDFTPHQALEHWGDKRRTDDRARIFHAAILEHQREMLEQI